MQNSEQNVREKKNPKYVWGGKKGKIYRERESEGENSGKVEIKHKGSL